MSSPYFIFGAQRRYPHAWHGGAGGVPNTSLAAESRGLGGGDLVESGLDPNFLGYPAFRQTNLHNPSMADYVSVGDWPLVRPQGPEPLDPNSGVRGGREGIGIFDTLSDNEKKLAMGAAALVGGFLLWKHLKKKRRNPTRARYHVSSARGRGRLAPSMSFGTKGAAKKYAAKLRGRGYRARVK